MTLRHMFAAAALGLAGLSAPALADPAAAPPKIAAASDSTTIDPKTDQRRVCVVGEVTGSRLARKECKTRAAWIAAGIDPLAKQ